MTDQVTGQAQAGQQAGQPQPGRLAVRQAGFSRGNPQAPDVRNEDAFITRTTLERGSFSYAAVFDGAGSAGGIARRACGWLDQDIAAAAVSELTDPTFWYSLARRLDMRISVSASARSTLALAAVVGRRVTVVTVGNSFVLVLPFDAPGFRLFYEPQTSRRQLGTGEAKPIVQSFEAQPNDMLVLGSDGVIGLGFAGIATYVRHHSLLRPEDVAEGLIGEVARRRLLMDDATVVVGRLAAGGF